jgi:ribosomal protein S11
MIKVEKVLDKKFNKQHPKKGKRSTYTYNKKWGVQKKGGRKNHKNRPKYKGRKGRYPRRPRFPTPSVFSHWKDPNPRTEKEKRNKKVRRLRFTKKGLRISRIVRKRFPLQKGIFVLYKYGMRRFFRKIQFYRKTNNFLVLKKTANNFFVTAFKRSGRMLFYISAGMLNLKGPRRSTTEAAERVVAAVCKRLKKGKIKNIGLVVKSPNGRVMKSAIRRLDRLYKPELNSLVLFMIPRSHNGVRGKKIKRG